MTRTLFSWVGDDWQVLLRRTLIVLLLACIFFIAGGGVSHKEKWGINDIQIRGAQAVSRDEIHATVSELLKGNYYFVYARDNSVLFPKDEIEQKLTERFARLESVRVERSDDHSIVITVAERSPYALWCGDEMSLGATKFNDCYFIDKTGFVLDRAPVFSEGVYVKYYGALEERWAGDPVGHWVERARFSFAQAFEEQVRKEIGGVGFVKISKEDEFVFSIRKSTNYSALTNIEIRLNGQTPAGLLVEKLASALAVQFPKGVAQEKKLQYIDMRFGNKIFFGFDF